MAEGGREGRRKKAYEKMDENSMNEIALFEASFRAGGEKWKHSI